jgi:hypothetical protein
MTLPLSTPGSCCGHNLNMHSGNGLEGTCVVCSCVGFTPDLEGQMAIRPDELRQCRAELHVPDRKLRCQGEVTEQTTHLGDHWAYVDDRGNKIHWSERIATYPVLVGEPGPELCNGSTRLSQVGGEHYRKFKIQPWDVIDEYDLSFYAGNALKYLLRAGHKGSKIEDLKKARHYLDKMIELEEGRDGG